MSFLFQAFGESAPLWQLLMAQAVFGLSSCIPGAPGMMGQFEFFGLVIFSLFLGLDRNLVAAVVLLSHILVISFSLVVGLAASLFFPPIFDQLKRFQPLSLKNKK